MSIDEKTKDNNIVQYWIDHGHYEIDRVVVLARKYVILLADKPEEMQRLSKPATIKSIFSIGEVYCARLSNRKSYCLEWLRLWT
jgi:hypothetical protein